MTVTRWSHGVILRMLLLGHLAASLALPHAGACGLGQSVGPLEGRDTLIATGPSDDEALLLSEDGVFRGLDDSEFDHAFRRNLDFFARLRIAANARLAVGKLEFSETRDGKDVLRLAIGQGGELIEKLHHRSFGEPRFLSEMLGDL